MLARAGIGIDDAENGAWVPTSLNNGEYKTNNYIDAVTRRLRLAEANGTVREELQRMKVEIEAGSFDYGDDQ
jgi:hypothetical protein